MAERVVCNEKSCDECANVIARTYRELRQKGYTDQDALFSSTKVLELRHPGHQRPYYFRCAARLLWRDRWFLRDE